MLDRAVRGRAAFRAVALAGLVFAPVAAPARAQAPAAAPFITPSDDVDVVYEMTPPDPAMHQVHQRMRWQSSTLRQRIDPDGTDTYMITSWRDRTLTVLDMARKRRSTMPAPGNGLTPPGQPAPGQFSRLGAMSIAGQSCTLWRTVDQDGRQSDVCYTDDGVLMQVSQGGAVVVHAVSFARVAQPDAVFAIPEGLTVEAPAHP